jgi:hypothetical protein
MACILVWAASLVSLLDLHFLEIGPELESFLFWRLFFHRAHDSPAHRLAISVRVFRIQSVTI